MRRGVLLLLLSLPVALAAGVAAGGAPEATRAPVAAGAAAPPAAAGELAAPPGADPAWVAEVAAWR
ncbi:MAG TPA: hypothetical protein VMT16_03845, partial [Thermoanaerobaculia bacterium]|nr:hypothetical protein [Thermoanaerobaculia bacterium]